MRGNAMVSVTSDYSSVKVTLRVAAGLVNRTQRISVRCPGLLVVKITKEAAKRLLHMARESGLKKATVLILEESIVFYDFER
jgi:hypothetical protein